MKTSDLYFDCGEFYMRPLRVEDVSQAYVDWMNDPVVVQYTESRFDKYTFDDVLNYVGSSQDDDAVVFLGLFSHEDDSHLGNIKLGPIKAESLSGDIGILIGDKRLWGRGMASRAIGALSDWALSSLGLRELTAGAFEVNRGSINAFLKNGFVVRGIEPSAAPLNGEPANVIRMRRRALPQACNSRMQEKARELIPGMTQLLSKRPDRFSMGVWPSYFSRAKGAEVWDLDGNRYVDMSIGGIGACVLGYADDAVDNAVVEAIRKGVASSLNCPEEVLLAEKLCELHPWADMARFSRGGGEAMAMAVRIARAHSGRDKVAFCGYHGWHDWYLAANLGTENALGEHLIAGLKPTGVPSALAGTAFPFRYNHLEELERIAEQHEIGVIVMEPIRSADPAPGFFHGVRALADRIGAVLIVDEISAGFRFNTGGAHRVLFDETPDMAVFSKALGNGYPISAVIGTRAVMQSAQDTFISSTNWTERTGFAAALATIAQHAERNVADHLVALGTAVQEGWKECAARHGLDICVSGMKPMSHFSFNHPQPLVLKAYFVQEMLGRGFLASTLFYAMDAHTDAHVQAYLEAVDTVFGLVARRIEADDVAGHLRGEPAAAGFGRLA